MEGLPWYKTAEIYCAVARRLVTVRFLTYDGQYPVGVISCSAFEDPTAPACGTPCVGEGADLLTTGARLC